MREKPCDPLTSNPVIVARPDPRVLRAEVDRVAGRCADADHADGLHVGQPGQVGDRCLQVAEFLGGRLVLARQSFALAVVGVVEAGGDEALPGELLGVGSRHLPLTEANEPWTITAG